MSAVFNAAIKFPHPQTSYGNSQMREGRVRLWLSRRTGQFGEGGLYGTTT